MKTVVGDTDVRFSDLTNGDEVLRRLQNFFQDDLDMNPAEDSESSGVGSNDDAISTETKWAMSSVRGQFLY